MAKRTISKFKVHIKVTILKILDKHSNHCYTFITFMNNLVRRSTVTPVVQHPAVW